MLVDLKIDLRAKHLQCSGSGSVREYLGDKVKEENKVDWT